MKNFILKVLLLCLFIAPASAQTSLQFNIVDGKTNKPILSLDAQKQISADNISVAQTYSPAKGDAPERWNFTIKNNDSVDRWLYLNWQIAKDFTANIDDVHYRKGKGDVVTGKYLLQNPVADASMNTTMLQTIYDDKSGVALALPPDQIVSQLQQSLDVKGQKYFLQLQIPLVLSAGQSDTFPIEVYQFAPRYGFLDALQKYFSAHPVAFSARTNIDPRAAGVGGSRPCVNLAMGESVEETSEKVRRFGDDWEWYYAPFRRTGDIYVRDNFWDYNPARPFNGTSLQPSAAIYRQKRHEQLEKIDQAGAAAAFYTPSFLYAEEQLAEQEYPGAIIRRPDGSAWKHYTTPWVSVANNEILLYPWGNKFAQQSMEDAKQLVAENDIPAFAYDIMAGGARFRGKGMKESPRRSFDADGEYVDSAVAIAKMADFTRSLEKDDKKIGLVGNITNDSRPFLVTRSDTLMCEQPPYFYPEELTALRYAAGHKSITFWGSYKLPQLLNTDDMTPEELRSAYQGAADYTRLASYRDGAYPSIRWSNGVPKMVKMLPLLKEVISKGWQAVPAVRGVNGQLPDSIWTARYGNDLGSFITVGNAGKTDWNGKIVIDNDYLGSSNYLFISDAAGKVLSQTVQGKTTILQVQIPARDTLVLRAVAAVPLTASGIATVSWNDDGMKGTLSVKSTFTPTKVLSPRDGWKQNNHQGDNWHFTSEYFNSPLAQIREFPFLNATSTAQIVLPKNPTKEEQWAAEHIQGYFQFWGQKGINPARKIDLPIVQDDAIVDTSKPTISISSKTNGVKRDGQSLHIGVSDLRESTLQLLAALDQKYFYTGVLTTTDKWKHQDVFLGSDVAAIEKAGLSGKTLN